MLIKRNLKKESPDYWVDTSKTLDTVTKPREGKNVYTGVITKNHSNDISEQFHSELKTDMDVERLPSGDFAVNSLILKIAMIAFNILRFTGQTALSKAELLPVKTSVKRKRLRRVITDLIFVGCKLVYRSGQKETGSRQTSGGKK